MNRSNVYHAGLSVFAQVAVGSAAILLFGLSVGIAYAIGGAFSIGFYFGREVAQAERKAGTPPWWSGFVMTKWSRDAVLDFLLPCGACTMVLLFVIC